MDMRRKMPKLNRVLISSIVNQVEELDSLSKEISTWLMEVDLSRKFPTAGPIDAETIETLKDYRGTAGEMYILLLESAYERINLVLRLMVEFVECRRGHGSYEKNDGKTLTSLVRVGSYARVASTAKLLWRRLKAWPEFEAVNSRDIERMAFADEYKMAAGCRLAVMAESKIALEKTVSEIRKEIIDRQVKENLAVSPPHDPMSRVTQSTQTNMADETSDEDTTGSKSQCVSPLLLITPDDDPVMDMTREILSNKQKIDDLLRQNERLSKALLRISRHNHNPETKSGDYI